MLTLRPYQHDALVDIRAQFLRGHRRVLYVLPTGGGKTVVFARLAHLVAARGKTITILVHREELVTQVCDALTREGVAHGVVAAGRRGDDEQVRVASVFTLARRAVRRVDDLTITDEAHHVAAASWSTALTGAFVLGVTATPCRLDGRGLREWFDVLITGPSVRDLTRDGHLMRSRVFCPPTPVVLDRIHTVAGDYNRGELSAEMGRAPVYGCAVEHYQRLANHTAAVAFCVDVRHAEGTAEAFRAAGISATSIDGRQCMDERRARIQAFRDGRVRVLCSCDLISEGFDLPGIQTAILLRPTKSAGLYLQQVGRALRPSQGKSEAMIIDHAGNALRHGLPDESREWSLDAPRRVRSDAQPPSLHTCMECYAIHPSQARTCPVCGNEREPEPAAELETLPADLMEIDAETVSAFRAASYREALRMARDENALRVMAAARGYKPGWVFGVLRSRAARGGLR